MASLLERMNMPSTNGVGPVRSKQFQSSNRGAPYSRQNSQKRDMDSPWAHDLYQSLSGPSKSQQATSLSARITAHPIAPRPNLNYSIAQKAIRDAIPHAALASGSAPLSIKGASNPQGNVVEVTGLVSGTTPEDVKAIFKRCGDIESASVAPSASITGREVRIRVTFKATASAQAAVAKFDGQPADGGVLGVKIVGSTANGIAGGRLAGLAMEFVRDEGSVDVLMSSNHSNGASKMRSDAILLEHADPRAQVLVAPPGADPAEYTQRQGQNTRLNNHRRGTGRGDGTWRKRGGGGGGGGRRGNARMDTD